MAGSRYGQGRRLTEPQPLRYRCRCCMSPCNHPAPPAQHKQDESRPSAETPGPEVTRLGAVHRGCIVVRLGAWDTEPISWADHTRPHQTISCPQTGCAWEWLPHSIGLLFMRSPGCTSHRPSTCQRTPTPSRKASQSVERAGWNPQLVFSLSQGQLSLSKKTDLSTGS